MKFPAYISDEAAKRREADRVARWALKLAIEHAAGPAFRVTFYPGVNDFWRGGRNFTDYMRLQANGADEAIATLLKAGVSPDQIIDQRIYTDEERRHSGRRRWDDRRQGDRRRWDDF